MDGLQNFDHLFSEPGLVRKNTFHNVCSTRSCAALRAANLDLIVRPGYSSGGYILGCLASWSVIYCPSSVLHDLSSVIRDPWSVVRHTWSVVRRLWSLIRDLLSVMCHLSSVTCCVSYVMCHPSSVIPRLWTVIRHPALFCYWWGVPTDWQRGGNGINNNVTDTFLLLTRRE